ncbi:MAG: iron-containing alcohol dehydrogenase [Tissierellia bacterium]|nr:iron-containing alcohol dehydrogenase [Tissierellia bacterium]
MEFTGFYWGYENLSKIMEERGYDTAAIIGGRTALSVAGDKLAGVLGERLLGTKVYGVESTDGAIEGILNFKPAQDAQLLLAVGGGKAVDTVKAAGAKMGKPVITVPTLASNCSATSGLSVIYSEDGSSSRYDMVPLPVAVLLDGEVMATAPKEYLWAGIGDGISKEFEVRYATKNRELPPAALMGLNMSPAITRALATYGKAALEGESGALEQVIHAIVVTTGYVSSTLSTEEFDYSSSLAHGFYVGALPFVHGRHLHGEVVSFGTLLQGEFLEEGTTEWLMALNESLGLPTTLEEISMRAEDLPQVYDSFTETIEYEMLPEEVSREDFIGAVLAVDALGRKRKAAGQK